MKPPPFAYARPAAVAEAAELLQRDEARVLAGGQSLVPLMNLRLARPSLLVDLAGVPGLDRIAVEGDRLVIGAMARQRAAETSPLVRDACPLLAEALAHVGHVQIRTRGTVVGSIAHADPTAELPVVAVVLGAEVVAASVRGTRTIPAGELFQGPYTTALEPDELLVAARFPVAAPGSRSAFREVARRAGDLAVLGAAGVADAAGVRLATTGRGGPVRLAAVEAAVDAARAAGAGAADAIRAGLARLDPPPTGRAAGAGDGAEAGVADDDRYRARLAPALVHEVLEALLA